MSAASGVRKGRCCFRTPQVARRQSRCKPLSMLDAGSDRTAIESATSVVGVSDASLAVAHGQISVLMGLLWLRQSTLLRAANGLNKVTRGRARQRRQGADRRCSLHAATLRRLRRRNIAMIFQQFGLLPWRTVRENVGFGLELRNEPKSQHKRIVDEKLELVGLAKWADRYGHELSGGMQQRVGLARAFATDADILLDGRAVLGTRSVDSQQTAGRIAVPAAARQENHPVRHARPGRGAETR